MANKIKFRRLYDNLEQIGNELNLDFGLTGYDNFKKNYGTPNGVRKLHGHLKELSGEIDYDFGLPDSADDLVHAIEWKTSATAPATNQEAKLPGTGANPGTKATQQGTPSLQDYMQAQSAVAGRMPFRGFNQQQENAAVEEELGKIQEERAKQQARVANRQKYAGQLKEATENTRRSYSTLEQSGVPILEKMGRRMRVGATGYNLSMAGGETTVMPDVAIRVQDENGNDILVDDQGNEYRDMVDSDGQMVSASEQWEDKQRASYATRNEREDARRTEEYRKTHLIPMTEPVRQEGQSDEDYYEAMKRYYEAQLQEKEDYIEQLRQDAEHLPVGLGHYTMAENGKERMPGVRYDDGKGVSRKDMDRAEAYGKRIRRAQDELEAWKQKMEERHPELFATGGEAWRQEWRGLFAAPRQIIGNTAGALNSIVGSDALENFANFELNQADDYYRNRKEVAGVSGKAAELVHMLGIGTMAAVTSMAGHPELGGMLASVDMGRMIMEGAGEQGYMQYANGGSDASALAAELMNMTTWALVGKFIGTPYTKLMSKNMTREVADDFVEAMRKSIGADATKAQKLWSYIGGILGKARETGYGNVIVNNETKQQLKNIILGGSRASLDMGVASGVCALIPYILSDKGKADGDWLKDMKDGIANGAFDGFIMGMWFSGLHTANHMKNRWMHNDLGEKSELVFGLTEYGVFRIVGEGKKSGTYDCQLPDGRYTEIPKESFMMEQTIPAEKFKRYCEESMQADMQSQYQVGMTETSARDWALRQVELEEARANFDKARSEMSQSEQAALSLGDSRRIIQAINDGAMTAEHGKAVLDYMKARAAWAGVHSGIRQRMNEDFDSYHDALTGISHSSINDIMSEEEAKAYPNGCIIRAQLREGIAPGVDEVYVISGDPYHGSTVVVKDARTGNVLSQMHKNMLKNVEEPISVAEQESIYKNEQSRMVSDAAELQYVEALNGQWVPIMINGQRVDAIVEGRADTENGNGLVVELENGKRIVMDEGDFNDRYMEAIYNDARKRYEFEDLSQYDHLEPGEGKPYAEDEVPIEHEEAETPIANSENAHEAVEPTAEVPAEETVDYNEGESFTVSDGKEELTYKIGSSTEKAGRRLVHYTVYDKDGNVRNAGAATPEDLNAMRERMREMMRGVAEDAAEQQPHNEEMEAPAEDIVPESLSGGKGAEDSVIKQENTEENAESIEAPRSEGSQLMENMRAASRKLREAEDAMEEAYDNGKPTAELKKLVDTLRKKYDEAVSAYDEHRREVESAVEENPELAKGKEKFAEVDDEQTRDADEMGIVREIANSLGMDASLADSDKWNGRQTADKLWISIFRQNEHANGHYLYEYDQYGRRVPTQRTVMAVAGHELTHRLGQLANHELERFIAKVEETMGEEFAEQMKIKREAYDEAYKGGLLTERATDYQLREEIAADYAGRMMSDKNFVDTIIKTQTDRTPSFIKKILELINRILPTVHNKEAKTAMQECQQLWAEALKAANKKVEFELSDKITKNREKLNEMESMSEEWLKLKEKTNKLQSQLDKARGKNVSKMSYEYGEPQSVEEFAAMNMPRITPESFRKETGYGVEEQKKLVGMIAGADKGGVSIEKAAEILTEQASNEFGGFLGTDMEMRDIIIDMLQEGNPAGYINRLRRERLSGFEDGLRRQMSEFLEQASMEEINHELLAKEARMERKAIVNPRYKGTTEFIQDDIEREILREAVEEMGGELPSRREIKLATYDTANFSLKDEALDKIVENEVKEEREKLKHTPNLRNYSDIIEEIRDKSVNLQRLPLHSFLHSDGLWREGLVDYVERLKEIHEKGDTDGLHNTEDSVRARMSDRSALALYRDTIEQKSKREGAQYAAATGSGRTGRLGGLSGLSGHEYYEIGEAIKAGTAELARREEASKELLKKYNVKKNGEIAISDLSRMFHDLNESEGAGELFDKVVSVLGENTKNIYIANPSEGRAGGSFSPVNGSVLLRPDRILRGGSKTILHELLHRALYDRIRQSNVPLYRDFMSRDAYEAARTIRDIYNNLAEIAPKDEMGKRAIYGANNAQEMVAELWNPRLRDALDGISYEKGEHKTMWQALKDSIKKLFVDALGLKTKENGKALTGDALKDLDEAVNTLLDNYSSANYNAMRGMYKIAAKIIDAATGEKYQEMLSEDKPIRMNDESLNDYTERVADWYREQQSANYSLKDKDKSLAGVHNISEQNLARALRLGGLANPSVAVIDTKKKNHTEFGDISLILPANKIDSRTGENAGTWTNDVWTPTYPSVRTTFTPEGYKSFRSMVDGLKADQGIKDALMSEEQQMQFGTEPNLAWLYLKERKKIDATEYKHSKMGTDWPDILRKYKSADTLMEAMKTDEALAKKVDGLMASWATAKLRDEHPEEYKQHEAVDFSELEGDAKKSAWRSWMDTMRANREKARELYADENGQWKSEDIAEYFADRKKEFRSKKEGVDAYWSMQNAYQQVYRNGWDADYQSWLDEKLESLGVKKEIRDGNDRYGNAKYVPNTLSNASRIMNNNQKQTGGNNYGGWGTFIAAMSKHMDTLGEIREKKGMLGDETGNEDVDYVRDNFGNLAIMLKDKSRDLDLWDGSAARALADLMKHPRSMKELAERKYGIELNDTELGELKDFYDSFKAMPVNYFETKFDRPVYLNEFASAVVPRKTSQEIVDALEGAGVRVLKYNPNIEGQRERVLQRAYQTDGVMFSLKDDVMKKMELMRDVWSSSVDGKGGLRSSRTARVSEAEREKATRIMEYLDELYGGNVYRNPDMPEAHVRLRDQAVKTVMQTSESVHLTRDNVGKFLYGLHANYNMKAMDRGRGLEYWDEKKGRVMIDYAEAKRRYNNWFMEANGLRRDLKIAKQFATDAAAEEIQRHIDDIDYADKFYTELINGRARFKEPGEYTPMYSLKDAPKESVETREEVGDHVQYSLIEDPTEIKRLDEEKHNEVPLYRSVQVLDGELRSPMAAGLKETRRGAGRQNAKTSSIQMGKWERSDENQELVDENGKITLDKGNGKDVDKVVYAPYIHTSTGMMNDQFSEAWQRPELNVVECVIPDSEWHGEPFTAEKAGRSTGEYTSWNSTAPVMKKLPKERQRKVVLSRWDKPTRLVPAEEIAQHIAEKMEGTGLEMPFNCVTPQVLRELAKLGVKIGAPEKKAGVQAVEAYDMWKKSPEEYYKQWNLDAMWDEAQRVAGVDEKSDAEARIDKRIAELSRYDDEALLTISDNGSEADSQNKSGYLPDESGVQRGAHLSAKVSRKFGPAKDLLKKVANFVVDIKKSGEITAQNFAKKFLEGIGTPENLDESKYVSVTAEGGKKQRIRIADHSGNAISIIKKGGRADEGYSIVVKYEGMPEELRNKKFKYNKHANVVEYVYENPDATRLEKVAKSIFGLFDTGEYIDLASADEVNKSPNNDAQYSLKDTPVFYSNAERTVEGLKQEKATPEQWKAMLQKAGGLKAEEDKWIGLSEWLDSHNADVNGGKGGRPETINIGGEEQNVKDLEEELRGYVEAILTEEGIDDAEIVGVKLIGSYMRGEQSEGSDLDLLVEYKGKASEDALFNIINSEENRIRVAGVDVDVNPITKGKSGTIAEFEKRNEGFTKKPATLTKQEVLDYIRENSLVVDEVHYSENGKMSDDQFHEMFDELPPAVERFHDRLQEEADELMNSGLTFSDAYDAMAEKYGKMFEEAYPKEDQADDYLQWSYLDPLLVLSGYKSEIGETDDAKRINTIRQQYTTDGLRNNREIAMTVPNIDPYNASDEIHFGDAGDGRAVVWMRFGDASTIGSSEPTDTSIIERLNAARKAFDDYDTELRKKYDAPSDSMEDFEKLVLAMTPEENTEWSRLSKEVDSIEEGVLSNSKKRVLVIDEVQSKRHQDGREKGYKSKEAIDAERAYTSANEEASRYSTELMRKYADRLRAGEKATDVYTEEEKQKMQQLNQAVSDAQNAFYTVFNGGNESVPDAPFRKNWHELGMKRMLRYAAENGYDAVAWTTGTQQAERYGIGHVVDAVETNPEDVNNYRGEPVKCVTLYMPHGKTSLYVDNEGNVKDYEGVSVGFSLEGTNLNDIIGNELTQKLLTATDFTRVEGNDLSVGGDGMKGFYDRMLPQYMDKYGKKWGVKTHDIELDLPNESDRVMHAVDVTPEMKQSVLEGQPMFSLKDKPVREEGESLNDYTERVADWYRGEKKKEDWRKYESNINTMLSLPDGDPEPMRPELEPGEDFTSPSYNARYDEYVRQYKAWRNRQEAANDAADRSAAAEALAVYSGDTSRIESKDLDEAIEDDMRNGVIARGINITPDGIKRAVKGSVLDRRRYIQVWNFKDVVAADDIRRMVPDKKQRARIPFIIEGTDRTRLNEAEWKNELKKFDTEDGKSVLTPGQILRLQILRDGKLETDTRAKLLGEMMDENGPASYMTEEQRAEVRQNLEDMMDGKKITASPYLSRIHGEHLRLAEYIGRMANGEQGAWREMAKYIENRIMNADNIKQSKFVGEYKNTLRNLIHGKENPVEPELAEAVQKVRDFFESVRQRMDEAGLFVGNDAEGEKAMISDYVTHIWDMKHSSSEAIDELNRRLEQVKPGFRSATNSPYTRRRAIPTLQEGLEIGLKMKYDDICDIMKDYGHHATEGIANKTFIDDLKCLNVVVREDGGEMEKSLPIIVDVTNNSPEYRAIPNNAIGKYKILESARPFIEVVFGDPRATNKGAIIFDKVGAVVKRNSLAMSFFHHGALTETAVGAMGYKAVNTLIKNIIWDSLKSFDAEAMASGDIRNMITPPALNDKEATADAVSHFVSLGATDDYATKTVQNVTKLLADWMREHTEYAHYATDVIDFTKSGLDSILWDYIHDGFKIYTFKKFAKEIRQAAERHNYSEDVTEKMLDEAGQLVNDLYGGQHWDLLMKSPAFVKNMRRWLLSPDWTWSTVRQALSPLGYGQLYDDKNFWEKWNMHVRKDAMTDEQLIASVRKKNGRAFWFNAALYFSLTMNALNWWNRKKDVEEQARIAEERRKTDPDYKSPYELIYPDGMSLLDYTMFGNTDGKGTLLFVGRYDDGRERYLRWGKQFRELPELFIDHNGDFSIPYPAMRKMAGKMNPLLNAVINCFGQSITGFKNPYMEGKKGWGLTLGMVETLAVALTPYTVQSVLTGDQEFMLSDLVMPSTPGFSNYKAMEHFEDAVREENEDLLYGTYAACVMNGLDAKKLLDAAIKRNEARKKAESMDGVDDLTDALNQYEREQNPERKQQLEKYMKKEMTKAYRKPFMMQEAVDEFQRSLSGDEPGEVKNELYTRYCKSKDVADDVQITAAKSIVSDTYKEWKSIEATGDQSAADKYYYSHEQECELYMDIASKQSLIANLKKQLTGEAKNDDEKMSEIRELRKSILDKVNK